MLIALLRRLAHAAGHGHVPLDAGPCDHIGVGAEHGAVPVLRNGDRARVRLLLPRQQLQQRAFAAAAAPHDDRDLPFGKGDGQIAQHLTGAALPLLPGEHYVRAVCGIGFVHVGQCDVVHVLAPPCCPSPAA